MAAIAYCGLPKEPYRVFMELLYKICVTSENVRQSQTAVARDDDRPRTVDDNDLGRVVPRPSPGDALWLWPEAAL